METGLTTVDRIGRYTGRHSYIQGSTHHYGKEGKTNNLGSMLYSVYAVLIVCCTTLYAILSVCCTWCQHMIIAWQNTKG